MAGTDTNSHQPDAVVVGGGIIGCAIALRLAQARLKVVVLERGEFGGEASSAAAGMIAPQFEMTGFNDFFQLCAASRDLYPTFVGELEDLNGKGVPGESVGYRRDGTLIVATSSHQAEELAQIYDVQKQHGLILEQLRAEEVHLYVPGLSPEARCGLLLPGDHRVDNERLTPALIEAGKRLGVIYVSGMAALRLIVQGSRITSVEAASRSNNCVESYGAGCFILAAGCWSGELVAALGIKLPVIPCRGQMVEFETDFDVPLAVREGLHYIVPRAPHRLLAGTTAEYVGHQKAVTAEGLRTILENVGRFAPFVNKLKFRRAWAGLRPDTPDHLPILGRGPLDNLIFATGHFRNGILLAPITAQLISEIVVTGSASQPIEAYRPERFAEVAGHGA
jgi:glycine oxidase